MKIKYLCGEEALLITSEGEIVVSGGEADVTPEQAAFILKEFPRWFAKPNTTPVLPKKEEFAEVPLVEEKAGKKKR